MEFAPSPPAWERRLVGRIVSVWQGNRAGGPWLPPAHLAWEPVTIAGEAGARIAARWFPAQAPRGTVVLAHPYLRYGKSWFEREGWVDFLHESGYDVLTFDFVGWGESRGRPYHVADLLDVLATAKRWAGGQPVHLLGVSMGAFFAANASPQAEVEGLVLESPYPSWGDWYGRGAGRVASRLFDVAFPRTARFLDAEANVSRALAKRILVVAAGEDDVTRPELSERVAHAAPAERTRWLRVDDANHLQPFAASTEYRRAILRTLR